LLPCTCELPPTLSPLYQTSSLLLGVLPIAAFANLRLRYSLLYGEHVNHIQVLCFLSFPDFYCVCTPLSVRLISDNINAFVLSL
jgi:hypothetical protein